MTDHTAYQSIQDYKGVGDSKGGQKSLHEEKSKLKEVSLQVRLKLAFFNPKGEDKIYFDNKLPR